jgi:hypothetical protein
MPREATRSPKQQQTEAREEAQHNLSSPKAIIAAKQGIQQRNTPAQTRDAVHSQRSLLVVLCDQKHDKAQREREQWSAASDTNTEAE